MSKKTAKASPATQAFLLQLIQPYRLPLLGGSLLMVVSAGAMLALPQYLKHMFDTALKTGDTTQLATLAGYMFATILVLVLSIFLRTRLIAFSSNYMLANLRNRLSAHLLGQDVTFFETRSSGEIVSRLTADAYTLREFLVLAAPQLVRGVFLGVGTLVALLYTSPSLAAILLLACAPIGFAGKFLGEKIRVIAKKQQDNIAAYATQVEETVANIRTINAFSQQPRLMQRFLAQTEEITRIGNYRSILASAFVATNVIIGFSALIGVVWLGGLRVMAGTMTLGDMMAFLLYLGFAADAASNVTNFWPAWQGTLGATERVIALLGQQPAITSPQHPVALKPVGKGRAIKLKNLTYTYPLRPETPALHTINLTIPAGANVAVVGPSGAGKSTLFRLLLRFDDPTTGSVQLDGTDIKTVALDNLRNQFALVSQESPLFTGTVADNVAFSNISAPESVIWAALRAANAESFVKDLPNGIHTHVGEKGVQLSGGQKQRIAIARAILADAPVLLLDEATAHLDSESEAAIQKSLAALSKGRTTVTIAHRLSTVKSADIILVLNHGKIEASGTHDQLLKSSKLYSALATVQLA
ncbi:MAG: ATP-binding cassette domain-containing protein [Alphaproteobacteria bacterium]|nr:MAG: ATP-binding cassette domain-containing protein [Alphaproteobacteria bacterium]